MTSRTIDRRPRVLVVGAGVAGLEFVLALTELAPQRTAVELLTPEDEFTYRPFAVAETFGVGTPFRLELERVAAHVGARLRRARVVSVDDVGHHVHTSTGEQAAYDLLVVACGARPEEALPGALTFRGSRDEQAFRALLAEVENGQVASLAFAVPAGASWPLPLYELALLTAAQVEQRGERTVRITLVTPEARPLERFDGAASEAVTRLLASAGIELRCGRYAAEFADGELRLVPGERIAAERVVTLPRLRGPRLDGLASDVDGFLPTDLHGLVHGSDDVYAAGDATSFPVKQGGIAIEQADAVAESVAARVGASVRPTPFRPLLRGLLLTGSEPRFLRADPAGGRGETSVVTPYPLWWPPGKIAGGRLADYLRSQGLPVPAPPAGPATLPVTVDLTVGDPTAPPPVAGRR